MWTCTSGLVNELCIACTLPARHNSNCVQEPCKYSVLTCYRLQQPGGVAHILCSQVLPGHQRSQVVQQTCTLLPAGLDQLMRSSEQRDGHLGMRNLGLLCLQEGKAGSALNKLKAPYALSHHRQTTTRELSCKLAVGCKVWCPGLMPHSITLNCSGEVKHAVFRHMGRHIADLQECHKLGIRQPPSALEVGDHFLPHKAPALHLTW